MTNADENTSDERERNADDLREEKVYLDIELLDQWADGVDVTRTAYGGLHLGYWDAGVHYGLTLTDESWRKVIDALERALADRGDS